MRALALALLLLGGCVPATGTIVEVQGPDGMASTAAGIATLELVVAHPSWCERWVQDTTASRMRADVTGRDLDKRPYDFYVAPSHQTDLTQPVYYAVLAYSSTGQLLGEATFGTHTFDKDKVYKHQARIGLFDAPARAAGGPKYVAGDGCVCVPGEPWLGTATGTGCDPLVITSFDRLVDTAGCELTPKGAPLPVPACDGQTYPNEPVDRQLPCYALDGNGACRVTMRHCADHDGQAWADECATADTDVMAPSATLCARYLACEQTACGDVTGCLVAAMGAPVAVTCTLRVNPATPMGQPVKPCPGGKWQATFPMQAAAACDAAVVQGVDQPPFVLGLTIAGMMAAQPVATACPLGLQIDSIDAPYPMAVPTGKTFDVIVGDRLARVTLNVALECPLGEPSLSCRLGP